MNELYMYKYQPSFYFIHKKKRKKKQEAFPMDSLDQCKKE